MCNFFCWLSWIGRTIHLYKRDGTTPPITHCNGIDSAKITYPMRKLHFNWSLQKNHHPPQNKFNGHAVPRAPMKRCSSPVQIFLGAWPQQSWRLQHQEPSPNLPPLPREDPTDFPILSSAHCKLFFSLSLCSQCSLQGCVDPQVSHRYSPYQWTSYARGPYFIRVRINILLTANISIINKLFVTDDNGALLQMVIPYRFYLVQILSASPW